MSVMATTYGDLNNYAKKTGAILTVQSMVTGKKISFPGFLTDASQTFSSTWNTEDVFGRIDPIATFQGTTRSISIGLTLPADTAGTAKKNLDACSSLASFLYPGYDEKFVETSTKGSYTGQKMKVAEIMSRPPLVKIRFGNLIKSTATGGGLLGYIDSFSFNPSLDDGVFNPSRGKFYPRVLTISISFNPLHQDSLGWGIDGKWLGKRLPFK